MLDPSSANLAYSPFISPMPIWDYWYLLILPLSAAVAVVYKAIRLHSMRDVPRAAAVVTLWIIVGMIGAAIFLGVLMRALEWWTAR